MNYKETLEKCGIAIPEVLLPNKSVSLEDWSVVACDQFSSDISYWDKITNQTAGKASTINLILPECYLNESETRVPQINQKMLDYLSDGTLESAGTGFIYLERSTPCAPSRKGLVVALDLEAYSYEEGAKAQIRPTEGTVLERLPVRAEIRKNAALDIPHILVLMDDSESKLFNYLEQKKDSFQTVYDFDLADNAGHLKGSMVSNPEDLESLSQIFNDLNSQSEFLFAVGDGNHSLAAAKQLWNKIKSEGGDLHHPARYALVELENIHDPGVRFEPIHRVLFDCSATDFEADFLAYPGTKIQKVDTFDKLVTKVNQFDISGKFALGMISAEGYAILEIEDQKAALASEAFHSFLDPWLKLGKCSEIDYIHGDSVLQNLGEQQGNIGFYLAGVNKKTFFQFINTIGPMPRKTFSIGDAEEKRYYLECRKLIP
jgi:hypothetical protein